ncbi:MAG: hypothetical protein B7733_15765 [Myxococcales bacterium FL481]|nr:MAG: hypothetical protein B7733_15765 [Myxococcales bacterium FL481]
MIKSAGCLGGVWVTGDERRAGEPDVGDMGLEIESLSRAFYLTYRPPYRAPPPTLTGTKRHKTS